MKNDLKKMFLAYGQVPSKEGVAERFAVYFELLSEEADSRGALKIAECIKKACKTSKYLPTVAEILEPIQNSDRDQNNALEEDFIKRFMKTKNNHLAFKRIPDDVYSVKMMIGPKWCETYKHEDERWVIKAAKEAYQAINKTPSLLIESPYKGKINSNQCNDTKLLNKPTEKPITKELWNKIREDIEKGGDANVS